MKAKLSLTGSGSGSRVELDGVDVSAGVRSLDLQASVGDVTRLTLDVMLFEGAALEGDALVRIPDATRDLLVQLGWQPPTPEYRAAKQKIKERIEGDER